MLRSRGPFRSSWGLALAAVVASGGCGRPVDCESLQLTADGRTSEVLVAAPPPIGRLRLWAPEAIMSDNGACSVYPVGEPWQQQGHRLVQRVGRMGNFGPGNVEPIDEHTLECAGVRFAKDSPVEWDMTLTARSDAVEFTIHVTNVGAHPIRRAGAAICLKFLDAPWWQDERVFVRSGGAIRSLAELGRDAGPPNGFEAYLLRGERFENVFYQQFWGFNRNGLDLPTMITEHPGGLCVGITARRAYFLHSNCHNPCTDIMLALGDIPPTASAVASGCVFVRRGCAADWLGPASR